MQDADLTRVAIVSDIHGNLPALRAVLEELDRRGPFEFTVGGGDFAFGGVYPDECVALVRDRGWDCVRGNTDEWIVEVATNGDIEASGYAPAERHTGVMRQVDEWAAARLDSDAVDFLAGLPLEWRMVGPSGQRLGFVHATPWSAHETVPAGADDATLERMLDAAEVDVLIYGHIHHAYIRDVAGRLVACAGSVGMPLDGDPRSCFLIVADAGDGWALEHVRVDYDRESYIADLETSTLPNAAVFAGRIRNAG